MEPALLQVPAAHATEVPPMHAKLAAHRVQFVFGPLTNVPVGHGEQAVTVPPLEKVLLVHAVGGTSGVAQLDPAGQFVHTLPVAYMPLVQVVQDEEPGVETEPAGQRMGVFVAQ